MAEKFTAKPETDDLAVLMPNREITLSGEKVTIREYSFKDALTIGHQVDQFVSLMVAEINGSNQMTIEQADSIIMGNLELVYSLISTSIQKPVSYIESLSYDDGMQLLDWWWVVNSRFFMNSVARKIMRLEAVKEASQ